MSYINFLLDGSSYEFVFALGATFTINIHAASNRPIVRIKPIVRAFRKYVTRREYKIKDFHIDEIE